MGQMVQDLLKNKLDAVAYHPRVKKIETASCYKLKTGSQFKSSKDCYSFNKQKSELIEAGKRNLTKLKPYWREFAYASCTPTPAATGTMLMSQALTRPVWKRCSS